MHILDFPTEILILISEFLDDEYCINALVQTCRRFYLLLNHSLYQFNVCYSNACALEWAAIKGSEATARYALEAGASPHATHYEEWLPTALACIYGHEPIVRLLLEYGVDPNSGGSWLRSTARDINRDDEGCPLILAAGRGHEDIVQLLLDYGVPPGVEFVRIDGLDISPLSVAVRYGHLSLVKLFVSLGSDVHIGAWLGANILTTAAERGHYEVVRFLLEPNPDLKQSPQEASYALRWAASEGYLEIVELLLGEHGMIPIPTMIAWPIGPLVEATQREYHAVVDMLRKSMDLLAFITHGEPDDDTHRELLLVSAACGWDDMIKELLDRGCSSDCLDCTAQEWGMERRLRGPRYLSIEGYPLPLALAAHRGHYSAFELLLDHAIKSDKSLLHRRHPIPLLSAIDGSQKQIVSMLLDHGADPNHRIPPHNEPVFFEAVQVPDILELLLDHGADPGLTADYGAEGVYSESVFMRALSTGSLAAAHILQERASFIEPRLGTGFYPTSFLEAAAQGGELMIKYLLDTDYEVMPGSHQVGMALYTVLSRSDTSSLTLLFERGLIGNLTTIDNKYLMAVVDSPSEDWDAVAATLDTLIAYGIDIEGASYSPLHDVVHRKTSNLSQLLLDRGADPLRTHAQLGITPLGQAARRGSMNLVRMMLKALEQRIVPLGELKEKLVGAEKQAELGQQERLAEDDVRPLLRRFYWRKKFQDQAEETEK
ncbi:uncharacterized protein N7487_010550 [Penicillium crustosum]|uniref:uncharacterized protein n=1 Tax=Penicillium crustosum TaxID=36656 RepID=UPI00238DC8B6|nr:uncharacterized protein N7487_010550 [Penicillium crustosum]KAJ5396247.1 hypothetical protein N7487_010550 [Penicillium crustosum]